MQMIDWPSQSSMLQGIPKKPWNLESYHCDLSFDEQHLDSGHHSEIKARTTKRLHGR